MLKFLILTYKHLFFRIILFLLLILIPAQVYAQHNHTRFQRITINDGLSLSSVYVIFQDSKGFMWFGTEDGLNRYDGKNIRVFRSDAGNKNSIIYKWIEFIEEDSTGLLWFGSRAGACGFDPKREVFYQYTYNSPENNLTNDSITCMFIDKENDLWLGTVHGLNKINPVSKKCTNISIPGTHGQDQRINQIYEDDAGIIWIVGSSGIFHKNKKGRFLNVQTLLHSNPFQGQFNSIVRLDSLLFFGANDGFYVSQINHNTINFSTLQLEKANSKPINVEQIHKGVKGKYLWVTCSDGLYKYDIQKNELKQHIKATDESHSLAFISNKPFYQDHNGNIWYGTFGEGCYFIDAKNNVIKKYNYNPAIQTSISENAINCIYEDNTGAIWFGTFGAGISIFDPQNHKFDLVKHDPTNGNSLASDFVWTIWEDYNGKIWIGTNNRGISVYDPINKKYRFYDHDPADPHSLSSSSVRDIFQDSKGRMWIGTDGGGLNLFHEETNSFTHFLNQEGNPHSISNNSVRVIFEDRYDTLWIGTRRGLNLFDPADASFKRYMHDDANNRSISHNFVYATIMQDTKDNLWIGTYGGGLNIMDYKTRHFTSLQYNPEDTNSLSDNIVFSIYEEPFKDVFWIGTNSGLNRYDLSIQKIRRFGISEGLPNDVVYSILPDKKKNIWMSTNMGLCCFHLETFDTKNFDVLDGLQSNEFNGGSFHKGNSGKLYFGGVYGLNIVAPKKIVPEHVFDIVTVTKIEILGQQVHTVNDYGSDGLSDNYIVPYQGQFKMNENIAYSEKIILDYEHRFISLEFSALKNNSSSKINYSYFMEHLDENWTFAGKRNYVSYANIPPGQYVFKAKAQNADGIWGQPSKGLQIIVKPPYWETTWFYILEMIIVAGIAFFVYRYLVWKRTSKILRVQNQKIFEANEKLTVSEQNLKELNATKDKFFSIIAHDLKNPFTTLLSVGEVIRENYDSLDDEEKHTGVIKMHDSVKYIYNLLENLLTWSRSQSEKLVFNPEKLEITRLIHDCIFLFRGYAENKGIHVDFDRNTETYIYADKEMIHTIMRNLLSNAVKFCSKNGEIAIKLLEAGQKLTISVSDTGTGIEEENIQKLFRIDAKYKTVGTSGEKGTGLGLILCKEFVEKNGGNIWVKSIVGQGSTFYFTVPLYLENH